MEKCRGRQHVSVRLNLNFSFRKEFRKQPPRRERGEAPRISFRVCGVTTHLADAGNGSEQNSPGLQDPTQSRECTFEVVDLVQSLRKDDAIKALRQNMRSVGEVRNNSGAWMASSDVQHILFGDSGSAESPGIGIISDLEDVSVYVRREAVQ